MTVAVGPSEGIVRWSYLWVSLLAIIVMIGVIVVGNLWLLNFVHVFSSLLWTASICSWDLCWGRSSSASIFLSGARSFEGSRHERCS